MRRSKRFPGDLGSILVPRDITKFARVGVVTEVDAQAGTCSVRWYDKPSSQRDVLVTQAFPGGTNLPEKGNVVLAIMDQHSRAFIVGYINLGHESRVKTLNTLPKFKPGEKLFEAGGSYIYLKRNGNVVVSTLTGGIVEFDNTSQTFKFEVVNWKLITEGGSNTFGLIKRLRSNGDGTKSVQSITSLEGDLLTEYNLKVYETADGKAGINPSQTPLVDITLGTLVDVDGNIVDANGTVTTDINKQLVAKLTFKNGIEISIDKEGKANIKGIKLNINNGSVEESDATLGENDSTLGTEGQKVSRVHDKVTIPIALAYNDPKFTTLPSKSTSNLSALQTLASAIISPAGPCVLNTALLVGNLALEGEITEGATNVYVGDD